MIFAESVVLASSLAIFGLLAAFSFHLVFGFSGQLCDMCPYSLQVKQSTACIILASFLDVEYVWAVTIAIKL